MTYHTEDPKPTPKKRGRGRPKKLVKEPAPAPAPAPAPEPAPEPSKKSNGKLSDKQKADLKSHMEKSGLSGSEAKSHRMGMMVRLRKGMSIKAAHSDLMKSK